MCGGGGLLQFSLFRGGPVFLFAGSRGLLNFYTGPGQR